MHNFAKFHHCRIYVTDFRKGAFLFSRLRAALKRPIVNKAITFCGLKFLRHFHFAGFLNNILFSWHFKFGFQPTCYNSRQFNFAVWPNTIICDILIARLCERVTRCAWVSNISGIFIIFQAKARNLKASLKSDFHLPKKIVLFASLKAL